MKPCATDALGGGDPVAARGRSAIVRPSWMRVARMALAAIAAAASALALPKGASASEAQDFIDTLNAADRDAFVAHLTATTFHQAALDAYWAKVVRTRRERRQRLRRKQTITDQNYVLTFPPEFEGPELPARLKQAWAAFQARDDQPAKPRAGLPDLADFLAASRRYYDFAPERIPEPEFKRRYASEALRLGLTKEQVVRVYALETGGRGTADMVAGINPITGKGRPISSALGYAQLLAANTLLVVQKHGRAFAERLRGLRDGARDPERRARLDDKIAKFEAMRAYVRRIPQKWSQLVRASRTGRGRGVHSINIDGDLGPWVQVLKLRDVKNYAVRAGRETLSPEQLELMNLAGPGTGLEMMTALGRQMPTSNFFSRRGYERNSIVRGRTVLELLRALGDRMDVNERNDGAIEFARIFDELSRGQ